MSIFRVLDQLESAIRRSLRIPLSGISLVDSGRILSILEKVRVSLPEEMKQARYLTQENHRILKEAHAKAEAIVAEAEQEAERRVAVSDIMQAAREQAEEVSRRAMQNAEEMRKGVAIYAQEILRGLESELERLKSAVRKCTEKLETPEQNRTSEPKRSSREAAFSQLKQ